MTGRNANRTSVRRLDLIERFVNWVTDDAFDRAKAYMVVFVAEAQHLTQRLTDAPCHAVGIRRDAFERPVDERADANHARPLRAVAHEHVLVAVDTHDHDAVIAQLVDVEIVLADAAAERGDQRADLGRRQHLVEARTLDVEDFALERQDRLRAPVAPLFGGAAGRVALDDEDLRQRRILLLTVGELAGKTRDVERALAARHLARLARRLARARRLHHLGDDEARLLRMLEQEFLQLGADRGLDDALDLG